MKELRRVLNDLESLRSSLMNNSRYDLKDHLDMIGTFINDELPDAINIIEETLDAIADLEDELKEANDRIDELEREAE
jgi:hypothetical protein